MKWTFFILTVVVSIPAAWQVMTPGYFPMHDNTQVVRVYEMHKALVSGQFPVRWVPDLGYGYGYPIFNFYNPLPYYVGTGFMFVGFDALLATKLMMAFGVVLAGASMFLLACSVLKRSDLQRSDLWRSDLFLHFAAALFVSILYVYAPYHAVQIYVRGAVAETWAYAILPLVFWAFLDRRVIAGTFALVALILSHNLTAFLSLPFVALLIIVQYFKTLKKKRHSLLLVSCFLLLASLGLSAFFWLPALVEAPKTRLSEMVFQEFDPPSKHLVTFSQLWNSPWGYGGSSAGLDDGMSFEVGKIHLIGSVAAIAILLYCYLAKKKLTIYQDNKITIFLASGFLLSIFLMLPESSSIWDAHPIFLYIQFPWRLLTFATLFSSVLSTVVISVCVKYFIRLFVTGNRPSSRGPQAEGQQATGPILLVTCSLLLVAYSWKFFHPQFKFPTSVAELTSRERIVWEVSRRSDEYLPLGFIRPRSLEEALRGGNPYNQQLVNEVRRPTFVQRAGNVISLFSFALLIIFIWKGQTSRQGLTF